jgi:hypothetical protein
MRSIIYILLVLAGCSAIGARAGLPSFDTDDAADHWLRSSSQAFHAMASFVDDRGGYIYRDSASQAPGAALSENGQRIIELSTSLKGPERVSTMIFEVTNHFQEDKQIEIEEDVMSGEITDAGEFAMRVALVEYDGLTLHRNVIADLQRTCGPLPAGLLSWIDPESRDVAKHELPGAFDAISYQRVANTNDTQYRAMFSEIVKPSKPRRTRPAPSTSAASQNLGALQELAIAQQNDQAARLWPQAASDAGIDAWLRRRSPFYDAIAAYLDREQPYSFTHAAESAKLIAVTPVSRGPERGSMIIYEVAKHYLEVQNKAANAFGETQLETANVAATYSILFEYDIVRLHYRIIQELFDSLGGLPQNMNDWLGLATSPRLGYKLPLAYDYLKACERNSRLTTLRKSFADHMLRNKKTD